MIPEDHKTAVISNGMHFMRSITEAYGAEEGLKLWDQIASVLDGDVKGQIFLAMVTGNYNDRILLKGLFPQAQANAVSCIKAIREHGLTPLHRKSFGICKDATALETFRDDE
jgi:hypothetical protein